MEKIDPKLTKKIQAWLSVAPQDRDVISGAMLLLQLNRNRALYNSAVARPQKFAAKIEYELKKHLRIRLDHMTLAEVAVLDSTVPPKAKEIIDNPPVISTDDELPGSTVAKGRRADHDQLPDNIRKLWDDNFDLYKTIKQLFEELKSMEHLQPCDRYDKLRMLEAADRKYRTNLAKYDEYVAVDEPGDQNTEALPPTDPTVAASSAKAISAARKTLSKYRSVYAQTDSEEKRAAAFAKIQESVTALVALGSTFAQSTREELEAIGISFDPISE